MDLQSIEGLLVYITVCRNNPVAVILVAQVKLIF